MQEEGWDGIQDYVSNGPSNDDHANGLQRYQESLWEAINQYVMCNGLIQRGLQMFRIL